jgi:peptidoglycan L-alanyl-D-glutamate endopeptidase CwlK
LDLIYAPFLERVLDVLADCRAAGTEYCATLGFRTWSQQNALYARGRTAPGVIVTHARAGESAHNYGLAIDFFAVTPRAPDGPLVPNWAPAAYQSLGDMANKHGLVWGGEWTVFPDRPHVQWPGYVTAEDMAPLRAEYEKDDTGSAFDALRLVWELLG